MYLSKRTRPDLLTAVSFLSTRVQAPTAEDNHKLNRLLGYPRSTRNETMTLGCNHKVNLSAHVDASYLVHQDARSHTGVFLTLGRGPIMVKSTKQKLVTRSSTESELVALAESTPDIIWCRNFLSALGFPQPPTPVMQDNKSTIILAERGYSSTGRTKHIDQRYYSTTELVARLVISLQYTPTDLMAADGFTKPLQGALFCKSRDILLGKTH